MALRGGISLDKDQEKIERAIQYAIDQKGRKFIRLRLSDYTKNRIQGAIVLHATPYLSHETNFTEYHFEERGGPLEFKPDDMNSGLFCQMLDCEHNRQFLASMFDYKCFGIQDKEVLDDITKRAERITREAINVPEAEKAPKEAELTDDELEAQAAHMQAEIARRRIAKSDLARKPVRQIINEGNIQDPEDSKTVPFKGKKKLVSIEE